MKALYKLMILCTLFSLLLCSCGEGEETSQVAYSDLVQPMVDVSITDCITAEELTAIVGSPMQLVGLDKDNSQLVFTSEDSLHQVTVSMKNQTPAGFEAEKNASLFDTTLQDGVGKIAYWCEDTQTGHNWLVFYSGGYAVTVEVSGSDDDTQAHDTYAKQIADKILDKLPTDTEN